MELFLEGGLPASVVELPVGEDPDSFLEKEGKEAFTGRLAKARPIFDYFIRDTISAQDIGSVEGKVKVVDDIAPQLKKIADPVERDLYIREVGRLIGVNERTLLKKVGGANVSTAEIVPQEKKIRRGNDTEEMLLALMGKYPEVAGKIAEYGVPNLFSAGLQPVAEAILERLDSGAPTDWGLILDQVEVPEERNRLASLFVKDGHLEGFDPLKMFEDLRKSKEKEALKRIKELKKDLARLEANEEYDTPRYRELQEEIKELCIKKSQLQ
jgi:DNA primase